MKGFQRILSLRSQSPRPPFQQHELEPIDDMDLPVSQAASIKHSQLGLPFQVAESGLPKPACQQERVANLYEIGRGQKLSERTEIANIMQLMCAVFNTSSALVALLDDEDLFVQDSTKIPKGYFPWRKSFCVATLAPANHQTFVCENAMEDIRFRDNPLVKAGLVNFYAGSPLISSAGHRVGTLCFTDSQPRKFDAESCNLLNNLGELVAREMERDWIASMQKPDARQKKNGQGLLRDMEAYNEPILFVDISPPVWRVRLANSAANERLGNSTSDLSDLPFWEIFQHDTVSQETYADCIEKGLGFRITGAHIAGAEKYISSMSSASSITLTFRSAGKDALDMRRPLVGVPADLPMTGAKRQFYFVTIDGATHGSPSPSSDSEAALDKPPFEGLELGPLLGKGGYGRVYRGILHEDQLVAVKVMDNTGAVRMKGGVPLEAAIAKKITHPHILRLLDYTYSKEPSKEPTERPRGSEDSPAKNSKSSSDAVSQQGSIWLMLEYCDLGCLQDACDKGWFRLNNEPCLPVLLTTAAEIAGAMQFLHARDIVHGDLTGGNVLITSDPRALHGWSTKVADFGMARNMDLASRVETRKYGRVTHQPPELLTKGILSKAADVYSFGVLLWEMFHCSQAWASMSHAHIIHAVTILKRRLQFSAMAPQGLVALASQCMDADPAERPSFNQIVASVADLQQAFASQPPSQLTFLPHCEVVHRNSTCA